MSIKHSCTIQILLIGNILKAATSTFDRVAWALSSRNISFTISSSARVPRSLPFEHPKDSNKVLRCSLRKLYDYNRMLLDIIYKLNVNKFTESKTIYFLKCCRGEPETWVGDTGIPTLGLSVPEPVSNTPLIPIGG
jgi:hypothetical protein